MSGTTSAGGADLVHPEHPHLQSEVKPMPGVKDYRQFAARRIRWYSNYLLWLPAAAIGGLWFAWPALTEDYRARVVPGYARYYGIKTAAEKEKEEEQKQKEEKEKK